MHMAHTASTMEKRKKKDIPIHGRDVRACVCFSFSFPLFSSNRLGREVFLQRHHRSACTAAPSTPPPAAAASTSTSPWHTILPAHYPAPPPSRVTVDAAWATVRGRRVGVKDAQRGNPVRFELLRGETRANVAVCFHCCASEFYIPALCCRSINGSFEEQFTLYAVAPAACLDVLQRRGDL